MLSLAVTVFAHELSRGAGGTQCRPGGGQDHKVFRVHFHRRVTRMKLWIELQEIPKRKRGRWPWRGWKNEPLLRQVGTYRGLYHARSRAIPKESIRLFFYTISVAVAAATGS